MEEQRITHMYLNLFKARLAALVHSVFGREKRRAVLLPWLLVLVLVVPGVLWTLHLRGRFGALKREVRGENERQIPQGPRPGGSEPLILLRTAGADPVTPQFLSATLLPGLGMDVLQITAMLPGRGEVSLLDAPSLQEMAGNAADRAGINDAHGALEVPWGGLVTGLLSPIGSSITTQWKGRTIELPVPPAATVPAAEGGLLFTESADKASLSAQGTQANGQFEGTSFGDRWPSKTAISTVVHLAADTLEIEVTAKNVGDQAEPMGIGWHPRFLLPEGLRQGVQLKLPAGDVLAINDRLRGQPSGKVEPASALVARFQGHAAAMGSETVDVALINTKPAAPGGGSSAELLDATRGIGLRVTALSSNIRELHVLSPNGARYVSLGLQTNYDDPFGRQWTGGDAIATLLPGASMTWKVRLEIFALPGHAIGVR